MEDKEKYEEEFFKLQQSLCSIMIHYKHSVEKAFKEVMNLQDKLGNHIKKIKKPDGVTDENIRDFLKNKTNEK